MTIADTCVGVCVGSFKKHLEASNSSQCKHITDSVLASSESLWPPGLSPGQFPCDPFGSALR